MKEERNYSFIIAVLVILIVAVFPVSAMGSRDEGKPEPVEVKTDQGKAESAVKAEESLPADYPPEGWVTDIVEAYKLAQDGDRQILVNFTGSDWCVWCKKLRDEVFSTSEFRAYADDNLVLLFLDFPNGINLPEDQMMHNQFLAQLLGVTGYPTLWLLDSDFSLC